MTDLKGSVQKQFDRVAANYRTSAVHARGEDLAELVSLAGLTGIEEVLDAGCGAGHTALALAPHAAQVTALDFTRSMLVQVEELARERQQTNVTAHRGDVESLPFPDGNFDLVVSRFSAHHWPHPRQALREFRRVLRQGPAAGGRVLLADVVGFDDPTCDTFLNAIELLRDPSHVRDFTATEWLHFFAEAGFQAEVAYEWKLYLDFTSWTNRMATPDIYTRTIRSLLADASEEVRQALDLTPDGFHLPCAIVQATL